MTPAREAAPIEEGTATLVGRSEPRAARWLRRLRLWLSGPLRSDVVALLLIALAFQVLFRYRHDWSAHIMGGGGLVLLVVTLVPPRIARWAGVIGFAAVAAAATVGEFTVFGPPDPLDVAVTLVGALVMFDTAGDVAAGTRMRHQTAASWGVGLMIFALAYRYVPDMWGP